MTGKITALIAQTLAAIHVYGPRWFVVAEAGHDRAWLTHVKNGDWYRTYFYSDAKDGWYSGTGGLLHGGAKGGVTIGRVEVVLRAGGRDGRATLLARTRCSSFWESGCCWCCLSSRAFW
jgi:hypothetical protein